MSMTVPRILIIALILSTSPNLLAQEWGKVEPEDLTMSSLPEDPDANAVVLFDIGEMTVTDDFDLVFRRHRRIKILTEKGKELANVKISYWHKDKFKNFKAHTILPSGKKIGLDGDQVFEEKSDDFRIKVFTFPGVEVGSIIEYKYQVTSEYITFLEPWEFQNDEFTRLSELSVYLPPGLHYRAFFSGLGGQQSEPTKETLREIGPPARTTYKFTWRMEDLKALRPEPHMGNIEDYRTTLYFQITEYVSPHQNTAFIKSWDDLAKEIADSYKYMLSQDEGLVQLVRSLVTESQSAREKSKTLYEYVRDHIEREGRSLSVFGLAEPHEVAQNKRGTGQEKNLLLVNLLRHAGLEAYPVLISTKSHGKFRERWVQLRQFNHVIVQIRLDGETCLLDASERFAPFGLLPTEDLNEQGFLLNDRDGRGEIVNIPGPPLLSMTTITTELALSEEGDLSCHTRMSFEGYHNLSQRAQLQSDGEEDYVEKKIKERFHEAVIDSSRITHVEALDSPLELSVHYRLPAYAEGSSERLYFVPPLLSSIESNPLVMETRRYPVVYDYKSGYSEELTISIPPGIRVSEAPKPVTIRDYGLSFTSNSTVAGDKVSYTRYYARKAVIFDPVHLSDLRDFFTQVSSSDQGTFVLER